MDVKARLDELVESVNLLGKRVDARVDAERADGKKDKFIAYLHNKEGLTADIKVDANNEEDAKRQARKMAVQAYGGNPQSWIVHDIDNEDDLV
jgi:hypothetical protein